MKITNNHNLPDPVFLALTEDDYTRGESNRSITQLIDAPQARILRHELDHLVTKDVSELIWLVLGKSVHKMFEKYATGKFLPEERLFMEIDGWVVSGQIDIQFSEDQSVVTLYDYKCTSVYSIIYGKDDVDGQWAQQLNSYARLVEVCKGLKVDKLKVVVILRDWRIRDAQKGGDYPQSPIMEVDIPLWSESRRAQFLEDRVNLHQDAEFERLTGGKLPSCSDEERWKRPSSFAVKKGKNVRAEKGGIFSSFEDAQSYIAKREEADPKLKFSIEERPATPNRCAMGYCHIAEWCDQYQNELKQQAKENSDEENGSVGE